MDKPVSDGMQALLQAQLQLHDTILQLQQQIEVEEDVYLEETPHGNILRGWEGFADTKSGRKDATAKKPRPYTTSERLFTNSCAYEMLAQPPSIDLVDYNRTEDSTLIKRRAPGTSPPMPQRSKSLKSNKRRRVDSEDTDTPHSSPLPPDVLNDSMDRGDGDLLDMV